MHSDEEIRSRGMIQATLRVAITLLLSRAPLPAQPNPSQQYEFNDSHFHLTNYIQQGTDIHDSPEDHGH